ncbi:MAG: serine/threonine protein kinase [Polyangiaceae bacterium]|nr:serine/threonine protein kinase [Polyangiaceae bacterium]
MEVLGPYEVDHVVGRGGSATVYAARRAGDDGPCTIALKVSLPSVDREPERPVIRRFLEEAKRMASVEHPAVVKVVEVGELPDGRAFLAMPLLEGETLATRLARGPLPVAEAMRLFGQLVDGAEALHDAGLVHRDIKPENVFLVADSQPRPVLLDLGLARGPLSSTTTLEGVVRGTPAVMAPERFFGTPASIASDVYELALLLYAMCAGRLPWPDDADVESRLNAMPLNVIEPTIPGAFSDTLMTALATKPERRPIGATALYGSLRAALRSAAPARVTADRPAARVERTLATDDKAEPEPKTKRRARSAALFATVVAVAAGALYFVSRRATLGNEDLLAPAEPAQASASGSASGISTGEVAQGTALEPAPSNAASKVASADTAATSSVANDIVGSPATASALVVDTASAAALIESASSAAPAARQLGIPATLNYCALVVDLSCRAKDHLCQSFRTKWTTFVPSWEAQMKRPIPDDILLHTNEECRKTYVREKDDWLKREKGLARIAAVAECNAVKKKYCAPELSAEFPGPEYTKDFCSVATHRVEGLADKEKEDPVERCQKLLSGYDWALKVAKEHAAEKEQRRKKDAAVQKEIEEGDLTKTTK